MRLNLIFSKKYFVFVDISDCVVLLSRHKTDVKEDKGPQTIWHPKLNAIPSILKDNFHLIFNDSKLSKIFKQKPAVTYQIAF